MNTYLHAHQSSAIPTSRAGDIQATSDRGPCFCAGRGPPTRQLQGGGVLPARHKGSIEACGIYLDLKGVAIRAVGYCGWVSLVSLCLRVAIQMYIWWLPIIDAWLIWCILGFKRASRTWHVGSMYALYTLGPLGDELRGIRAGGLEQHGSGKGARIRILVELCCHFRFGLQTAQSRSYLYTLGPQVGIMYILGALGI